MNMPMWFSNLVFWSAQVALLAAASALLPYLLRIRQPRILLAYWRSVVALSLLLPLLQPWHRPKPMAAVTSVAFEPALTTGPPSPTVSHWQLPSLGTAAPILGIVILVGIVIRLAVLALGLLKLRRLRRTSLPIVSTAESFAILETMRTLVSVRAEFRLSASVDSPVTFGFVSPIVLLPQRFSSLEPRFQSAIACHELLHVRRRDWAHHLGEEFLRAVFWFHPAVAWVISRVRLTREQVVDLEVVKLTQARKPYLESLLEFTNARARLAAIPAPPFLAERQLVERIALMLKEVRMSRTRLVASLAVIPCCLALVIAVGAWTFPLKAAPRALDATPDAGVSPKLQRIEVKHHDFDAATLNDAAVSGEETRLNQLPDRLRVESSYDQTKAERMRRLLEDFWKGRGVTVEVRTTLAVSSDSPGYAVLEFDVYKQTLLPGRLEGGVRRGISGGVSGGVAPGLSGTVANGVNGGVSGGVNGPRQVKSNSAPDGPDVDVSTIWTDTVKRGQMVRQVRGLGKLVSAGDSALVAKITIPVFLSVDVRPNQSAAVDTHMGVVKGHVVSINPSGDTCSIDLALDSALPERATVGLTVDGTIDIEKLENVLSVGRPVHGVPNTSISLFKIDPNGLEARRVTVKFGRGSVNSIEILSGLQAGDKIILSDMSDYDSVDSIHLTDNRHVEKH